MPNALITHKTVVVEKPCGNHRKSFETLTNQSHTFPQSVETNLCKPQEILCEKGPEGTNSVFQCEKAMQYPYRDPATCMANELNRYGPNKSKGVRAKEPWQVHHCTVCRRYHVMRDGEFLAH